MDTPIALTIPDAVRLSGCSRSALYAALKRGDRILARNEETERGWRATPIKKLPARSEGLMGVVEIDGGGKPWLAPVDKRVRNSSPISDLGGAEEGELVLAERNGKSPRAGVKLVEGDLFGGVAAGLAYAARDARTV